MSGTNSIAGTEATLITNQYLPLDSSSIPEGHITSYPGVEAEKTFTLGKDEPNIDDCFIVNTDPSSVPVDTRSLPLKRLVKLYHPDTSLHFEVHSTEPAFQFYTGKGVDVPAVEGAPARGARSGICIEPSRYVNAPNEDAWRGMCLLKQGQKWGQKTVYKAWKA